MTEHPSSSFPSFPLRDQKRFDLRLVLGHQQSFHPLRLQLSSKTRSKDISISTLPSSRPRAAAHPTNPVAPIPFPYAHARRQRGLTVDTTPDAAHDTRALHPFLNLARRVLVDPFAPLLVLASWVVRRATSAPDVLDGVSRLGRLVRRAGGPDCVGDGRGVLGGHGVIRGDEVDGRRDWK
jgi:hypothetical protein